MKKKVVNIIGGGLAGSEAALYLAGHDIKVNLFEMRPGKMTPAHKTSSLGELICSNSLKSNRLDTGAGLLKAELNTLGCKLLEIAEKNQVKSGAALTVDCDKFAKAITDFEGQGKEIMHPVDDITTGEDKGGGLLCRCA